MHNYEKPNLEKKILDDNSIKFVTSLLTETILMRKKSTADISNVLFIYLLLLKIEKLKSKVEYLEKSQSANELNENFLHNIITQLQLQIIELKQEQVNSKQNTSSIIPYQDHRQVISNFFARSIRNKLCSDFNASKYQPK